MTICIYSSNVCFFSPSCLCGRGGESEGSVLFRGLPHFMLKLKDILGTGCITTQDLLGVRTTLVDVDCKRWPENLTSPFEFFGLMHLHCTKFLSSSEMNSSLMKAAFCFAFRSGIAPCSILFHRGLQVIEVTSEYVPLNCWRWFTRIPKRCSSIESVICCLTL